MRFLSLLLFAACLPPEPKDEDSYDPFADDDTSARDDEGTTDDDWWGRCEYVAVPVAADETVDELGGTPNDLAAALSGTRSSTFHWDETGEDTPFDHTLTVDATTAQLWVGSWVEGDPGDTGGWEVDVDADTDADVDGEESGGGSSGGSEGSGGGSSGEDEGEEADPDTGGGGAPDTGGGRPDTGDTGRGGWDTGEDVSDHDCPSYFSVEADWTLATGDGHLAEELRVEVHAESLSLGRIDHEVDYDELVGDWVPGDIVPAEWDEVRVSFAANVGVDADAGEMALFAERVYPDEDGDGDSMAEATMGDVGRWPAGE